MKNSDVHNLADLCRWLSENHLVPFRWGQESPCDPGDFTGRHEAVRTADGWVWAKHARAD